MKGNRIICSSSGVRAPAEVKGRLNHIWLAVTMSPLPPFVFQNCLSVPDIKTAFSDCAPKIGKRDCLVQPCTALTG